MSTPDNVIFVFGSNTQGRHGKGAALHAVKEWGAIYGQARGRQGDAYAIVTKELRRDYPAVTLDSIREEVASFRGYASIYPSYRFKVTAIGCGLAGFTPEQIAPLFMNPWDGSVPSNVILPKEFKDVIKACKAERAVHTWSPTFQTTASEYLNVPPIMSDGMLDALRSIPSDWRVPSRASHVALNYPIMLPDAPPEPRFWQEPDGTRRAATTEEIDAYHRYMATRPASLNNNALSTVEQTWMRRELARLLEHPNQEIRELARLLEHPNQEIEERDDDSPF